MAGPDGSKIIDGMAEVMDLDYPLEDADWEMMVAGPADDQYNDLLSKEVLQQLGLFGTPADTAEGGAPREVPLLLQQPGGGLSGLSGLSGLGNAAKQVAELLAGTHPSMRGTSLEDWLAADGPVVAITATGLPDAAGGGGQRGGDAAAAAAAVGSPPTGASATPTPLASSTSSAAHNVASSAALSPSVAPPAGRADTASLPSQPAVSGPMALQHQLQLMQAAAAQPTASMLQQLSVQQQLSMQQQQQQQSHILLPTGELVPVPPAGQLFQQVGQPVQPAPAPPAGWQEAPMPAAAAPEGLSLQQQDGQPGLPADLLALLSSISGAGPAAGSHPPTPSGSTAAPEAASVVAVSGDLGAGATPLLAQLLSELSGLQGLELPPVAPAAPLHGASAPAPAPQVSAAAGPMPSLAPSITLGGGLRGMDEDEEEGGGSGLFTAGADSKPTTLKRFSDRQKARISKIESELAKLERDMHQMKLENARLKSKNTAVEQQLRTQQQLQQLAAAVTSATAAAAAAAEQQQLQLGDGAAAGGLAGHPHAAPSLSVAAGLSPPNSQKKLLLQLSDSMRPQDREMMAVAALTWPKLQDWYCKQVARFKDALQKTPSLGADDAERACKDALRAGRYWDLLVLISRPDLSARLLQENMLGSGGGDAAEDSAGWAPAAVEAMQLSAEQRSALAAAWQRHREAAEQRAAKRQELLGAIRSGFLVHLQRASPEDIELGKPLARQGLGAMEALRLVVRQEHVSAVQVACGLRKVLTSLQQARLAAAAWPWYPDPAKWAPTLLEAAGSA